VRVCMHMCVYVCVIVYCAIATLRSTRTFQDVPPVCMYECM